QTTRKRPNVKTSLPKGRQLDSLPVSGVTHPAIPRTARNPDHHCLLRANARSGTGSRAPGGLP
ncbi:MAG: hypothetical protein ACLP0L_00405, partial [Solirubrobacteraceae bacterium]